jgi:hypothetical protein
MRKNGIRAGWFGLTMAACGWMSCAVAGSGFLIALPNGYEMIRDRSDAPAIVKKSGSKVVPGPIAAYAVVRDVVTGQVHAPAAAKTAAPAAQAAGPAADAKQGYFVLDTQSGKVEVSLSEADWNERLKNLGITAAPSLNPPLLPR